MPGKQTRVQALDGAGASSNSSSNSSSGSVPVQRRGSADADGSGVQAAAAFGTSGASSALPFQREIQRSFGAHDVSGIAAFTDDRAARGAGAMGAQAFATGERVAFAGAPDLHTVAHEAAHVVQQRAGVSLEGGVGQRGDSYERAADAVADAVVRGEPAHELLGGGGAGSSSGGGGSPVQRKVPDDQRTSVAEHYDYLVTRHGLDGDAHIDILTEADEHNNSAKDAIAHLEDELSPTSVLKALVRQKKFKEVVDEIKRAHNPAAAQQFDIQPIDDYAKVLPKGEAVPPGIPFGLVVAGRSTTGKDAVIYIHQHWIERWVLEDQIGSLLNTIEHEATHAGQKNSSATPFANDTDVMELEAYTHEILTAQQKLTSHDPDPPTQAQLTKAHRAGKAHFDKIEAGNSTTKVPAGSPAVATQRARWNTVEQIYPTLRTALGQRDQRLRTSYHEARRFQSLLAEYEQALTKLAIFEGDQVTQYSREFGALFSEAGRIYLRLLASHQEMDDVAQARLTSQMARVDVIDDEFDRYNRSGPRRSKAKRSTQSSSSSGGLSLGGLGSLPPPPGSSNSSSTSAPSVAPPQQQSGSSLVGATPTTTATPTPTPTPTATPTATATATPTPTSTPQLALTPQAHDEASDDEFGEFQSA
ncbi:MAG TPA: DUF4157 domain-containing protein [Kofleriaceae bacterium]|nr:DUF4157 domain-containing protein [Kofleriaceae bacterium]